MDGARSDCISGRRPLAILALLAVVGPRGLSRDKLLAYLWSESDTEHGRNALSQVLFSIRRDLGRADVIIGRADLRLNGDAISSDVQAFESAYTSGAMDQAAALYDGSFLDGFFLNDAPEFEHWVEQERARLNQLAQRALEQVANGAEERGDHRQAVDAWRKLAAFEPLNGRVALALVRALAALGERDGAIRYAEAHESLLKDELNVTTDPVLRALIEQVRSGPTTVAATSPTEPPSRAVSDRDGKRSVEQVSPTARSLRRRAGIATVILVAVAATAIALNKYWPQASTGQAVEPSVTVLAVLPFTVNGPPELSYLRNGLVDLVSRDLDGAGDVRAVDPHVLLSIPALDSGGALDPTRGQPIAARLGASRFILGDVVASGSSVRITAAVYDGTRASSRISTATVEGSAPTLLAMVHRLSAELLASQTRGVGQRLAQSAAQTTNSLLALRAYLDGESQMRRNQYALALDAFQRAVREDSTFALAYYRLSDAADWADRSDLIIPAAVRAASLSNRLSDHESLLVRAYLAWREGRIEDAEGLYGFILRAHPDDVEAWYQLGELLFHGNPLRGRSFTAARDPFQRVVNLQPGNRAALTHLARIAARGGRRDEIDSVTTRALRDASANDARELRALRAFALHDTKEQARLLRDLAHEDRGSLPTLGWRIATFAGDLAGAERVVRLAAADDQSAPLQAAAYDALMWIDLGRGRRHTAYDDLLAYTRLGNDFPEQVVLTRATWALIPFSDVPTAEIKRLRAGLEAPADSATARTHPPFGRPWILHKSCIATLLRVQIGDSIGALRAARTLERAEDPTLLRARARACSASVRARVIARGGRIEDALVFLRTQRRANMPDLPYEPGDRFLIAEWLHALGRETEALAWYGSIADIGLEEVPYVAVSTLRSAEIHERLGERGQALACYQRFLELWKDADPALSDLVATAQQRARALQGADQAR